MPPPHHPPSFSSPRSTDDDATHKSRKPGSKRAKSTKPGPRGAKRVVAAAPGSGSRSPEMGHERHKRVKKACERCRMKKTKCDGESPCKRCRDDGLVCTAGHRKKAESKRLPCGYAKVLENTQYELIATVHKLYAMVLAGEQWTLDPPATNTHGQPVIHDIVVKLGCILADQSSAAGEGLVKFPADAAEFAELPRRVESEDRAGAGDGEVMGRILSVATGPERQSGDDTFYDYEPGFEMDDLHGLPIGGYKEFISASSSTAISTAAVSGQMRLPSQLQLTPQQQQQQQAALEAQEARQMQMQIPQQQNLWGGSAATKEQMHALMGSRMCAVPEMGGMGSTGGDGTIRPNLLVCGFGPGAGIDNETMGGT
ncbi:Fluconazole resistance protein 1 [Pseudogymnoascus australis]